jgi:hypothetical protein
LNETVRGTNERLDRVFDQQAEQFNEQKATAFVGEYHSCHKALKTSNYESFKDINPSRTPGTCQWVLGNQIYLKWRDELSSSLLWVSADPGCGKSVLSKSLIDIEFKELEPGTLVCYFFFKDKEQQNQLNVALCALLHQIFTQEPALISYAMDLFRRTGDSIQHETSALWNILLEVASESKAPRIICVLDALDECTYKDVETLIQNLCLTFEDKQMGGNFEGKARLKFFVTSRPYLEIQTLFSSLTTTWPQIQLKGEEENDQIKKEIDIVIAIKMQQLAREAALSSEVRKRFETQLLEMESRTYLWLHLALDDIRMTLNNSLQPDAESIRPIPPTVDAAYANILARVQADQFATVKKILLIICGARRPLTVQEMAIALGIALKPESSNIHSVQLDPTRLSSRIRSLCGLFVIIIDGRIHLLHQTAKEFLIRDNSFAGFDDLNSLYPLRRTDTESILAEICVRYLLMDDFRGSEYRFELWRGNDSKLQDCPVHPVHGVYTFLDYSAEHWARHVRHMSTDRYIPIEDLICQLYDTSSQTFLVWFNLFWQRSAFQYFWSHKVDPDSRILPLCLAALNGHEQILKRFLMESKKEDSSPHWNAQEERDPICGNETCVLIWSSWPGNYDIRCLLLEQVLFHAIDRESRKFEVLENLLGEGAPMKMTMYQNNYASWRLYSFMGLGTVLHKAAELGQADVAYFLLQKGIDTNIKDAKGHTALDCARTFKMNKVVKVIEKSLSQ